MRPQASEGEAQHDYFAGLDVAVKDTSVCIVDDTGKIVREVKVASEPAALLAVLKNPAYRFKRIGLEAGPMSQWLFGRRDPATGHRGSASAGRRPCAAAQRDPVRIRGRERERHREGAQRARAAVATWRQVDGALDHQRARSPRLNSPPLLRRQGCDAISALERSMMIVRTLICLAIARATSIAVLRPKMNLNSSPRS